MRADCSVGGARVKIVPANSRLRPPSPYCWQFASSEAWDFGRRSWDHVGALGRYDDRVEQRAAKGEAMQASVIIRRAGFWLRRYGPSEVVGTVAALLAAGAAFQLSGSRAAAALAATWAECVVYYALIVGATLAAGGDFTPRRLLIALRNLLIEFGPAELLDSLLLRPAALYGAMTLTPTLAVGTIVGKLVADLCFYTLAILALELRTRLLPDEAPQEGLRVPALCPLVADE